jgi:hypothetical protein
MVRRAAIVHPLLMAAATIPTGRPYARTHARQLSRHG